MSKSQNKRTVVVGLFIILGLLFFMSGIFMVGNLHKVFNSKINLISNFEDVKGLQKGDNIWFSGVKIGTVNNVRIYGPSKVEVNMNIESKEQKFIHKDAKVKISTDGFIGNKILVIFGGTERYAEVQDGDTLVVEKTLSTEDIMNTLQKNNKNLQVITSNFKTISKNLIAGEGTIGKLLADNSLYTDIRTLTSSLKQASEKAQQTLNNLNVYSAGLNKEGTLANQLVSDTVVFNSFKYSMLRVQQIADTATVFIANLKQSISNPKSSVGLLLNDEETGTDLKETIKNLESSSKKLNEDLEALKHNFLFKKYFKNQAKAAGKNYK
ncbi:MAG: MCE family protein [Bacteroidales bacterium]|nr:MCE family protein [Bacteroidales bacterium]